MSTTCKLWEIACLGLPADEGASCLKTLRASCCSRTTYAELVATRGRSVRVPNFIVIVWCWFWNRRRSVNEAEEGEQIPSSDELK